MDHRGTLRLVLETYVVAPFAYLPRGLRVPRDRDLIVGRGTRIDGAIRAGGRVILCNGVEARGAIDAASDVVAGARSRLHGAVEVRGDAILLEGVRVDGPLNVKGSARILGAHVASSIRAGGDIEVRPPAVLLGTVDCGGRVRSLEGYLPPTASPVHPGAPPRPAGSSVVLEHL